MTRREAYETLYEIINSGILDLNIESKLTTICNSICNDDWEDCNCDDVPMYYCHGCDFLNEPDEDEEENEPPL